MTVRQKLETRSSEIRQALNDLSAQDSLTEEQQAETDRLTVEFRDVETRLRAAILAEPEAVEVEVGDGEKREATELRDRSRLGRWIAAAVEGRTVDGAEAEYSAACGVSRTHVPLALFGTAAPVESRAITPAPSTAPQSSARPTVPAIFERSISAALGIEMPTVPTGQANFLVVGTAPPSGMVAKDGSASATAGAITLASRTPKRLAGQFEVRVEDMAVMDSIETDLRRALADAMSDELDNQVIAGNGTDPNLAGLFNGATDVAADGTTVTFATGVSTYAAMVDGKHAYSFGDLRGVIGSATFAKFASVFASNTAESIWDYLAGRMGAFIVSDRVPAKASNAQKGLVVLAGGGQAIQVPVWDAVTFIADPYSGAGAGKRTITATSLISDPWVPYGTSQVVETHPKIS